MQPLVVMWNQQGNRAHGERYGWDTDIVEPQENETWVQLHDRALDEARQHGI